ncbi:MAG: 30S ribosome-binding factor RbfA [Candidatus Aquicultorales bacterium]
MSERTEKVSETIKQHVSEAIQRELKDPRVGFVTVTGVDVSPDLKQAKVYVTVLGGAAKRKETLDALNSASGYMRSGLGKRMRTKFTPHLTFVYDETVEKGLKIDRLISKVTKEDREET